MKSLKRFALTVVLMLQGAFIIGQNETDALRFSQSQIGGTARVQGLAGAYSTVGADYSSTNLNPAGLGFYRKSDLQFTPYLRFTNSRANYLGMENTKLVPTVGLSNFGFVFGKVVGDKSVGGNAKKKGGFKSWAFSVGFNQIANYNRNAEVQGYNDRSSITSFFATRANGKSQSALVGNNSFAGLAYSSGLIIPHPSGIDGSWNPSVKGGNVEQTVRISERGRLNEWSVGLGGNISDFLYIGIAASVEDLKFNYSLLYEEEDIQNLHNVETADSTSFSRLEFSNEFQTRGAGFNARVGLIIRPLKFLRLGVNIQTPTWYNLTDTYSSNLTGEFDGDPTVYGINDADNPPGKFKYNLITPFKASAGAMVMFKKFGFLSADFEITDYAGNKFASASSPSSTPIDVFSIQNQAIKEVLKFGYNFRVGAEVRIGIIRLRGGYANLGSAVKKEYLSYLDLSSETLKTITGSRQLITGGFGIKKKFFYLDLAYVMDVSENKDILYDASAFGQYSPELIVNRKNNTFLMTIGFTF